MKNVESVSYSLCRFLSWRHNQLRDASCNRAIMRWLCEKLDIDFIHGDIHAPPCKNGAYLRLADELNPTENCTYLSSNLN